MYVVARVQSPNFEGSMRTKTMLRYKNMSSNFVCFVALRSKSTATVSSPNHTFSFASLNKRLISTSRTYFRL